MRDIINKLEKLNEDLGDMAREAEKDHEVQMARADLYKSAKYAVAIHKMLKDVGEMEGIDGWVAAKITKAADYLGSVKHYMEGEMMADVELAVVPVAGDMTDAMTMPQEQVSEAMTKVTDIKWDADEEKDVKDLSTTMMVPVPSGMDKEEAEDFIADYITDKTGFTHGGFKIAEAEQVDEEDVTEWMTDEEAEGYVTEGGFKVGSNVTAGGEDGYADNTALGKITRLSKKGNTAAVKFIGGRREFIPIKDLKLYDDITAEGRLGFSDLEKFGDEMASKIDLEARRRGSADMEPGDADRLRYEIAKEMGLVESDEVSEEDVIGDIIAKLPPTKPRATTYTQADRDTMNQLIKKAMGKETKPKAPAAPAPAAKMSAVTQQKQNNAAAKMQTNSKFSEWSKK